MHDLTTEQLSDTTQTAEADGHHFEAESDLIFQTWLQLFARAKFLDPF